MYVLEIDRNKLLKKILEYREENELDSKVFLSYWPQIIEIIEKLIIKRQKYIRNLIFENGFFNFFIIEVKLVCLMNITMYEAFEEGIDLAQYIDRNLKYAHADYFECILAFPEMYREVSIVAESKFWQTCLISLD